MSSDATDNTMRAEFEAWAHEFEIEPAHGARARLGCVYEDVATNAAFAGWKAARADTARKVDEAVAAEREELRKAMRQALFAVPRHQRGSNDMLDFYIGRVIAAR